MSADSYRVPALVASDVKPKHVFAYYVMKDYRQPTCPVCGNVKWIYADYDRGVICHPTRRVVVSGFWFWRRYCPVVGIHRHFKCDKCGATNIRVLDGEADASYAAIRDK